MTVFSGGHQKVTDAKSKQGKAERVTLTNSILRGNDTNNLALFVAHDQRRRRGVRKVGNRKERLQITMRVKRLKHMSTIDRVEGIRVVDLRVRARVFYAQPVMLCSYVAAPMLVATRGVESKELRTLCVCCMQDLWWLLLSQQRARGESHILRRH